MVTDLCVVSKMSHCATRAYRLTSVCLMYKAHNNHEKCSTLNQTTWQNGGMSSSRVLLTELYQTHRIFWQIFTKLKEVFAPNLMLCFRSGTCKTCWEAFLQFCPAFFFWLLFLCTEKHLIALALREYNILLFLWYGVVNNYKSLDILFNKELVDY